MAAAWFEDIEMAVQELEGTNLDVAMAQHLLVAADRFQLSRLRQICERRLCETVEVSSLIYAATSRTPAFHVGELSGVQGTACTVHSLQARWVLRIPVWPVMTMPQ